MAEALKGAQLPPLVTIILRPWVGAVETASRGMCELVIKEAVQASMSLKRRAALTPELEMGLEEARVASEAFARSLEARAANSTAKREAALAALVSLIVLLRTVQPSENTRDLGLGW
ncbi:hypothetical protein [Methylobacterium sp. A54F]